MGYEFKSSRDYTRRNPASKLEYIDISIFADGKEEFVKSYVETIKWIYKQSSEYSELVKPLLKKLNGGIDDYLKDFSRDDQQIYQKAEEIEELIKIIRGPEIFEIMEEVIPPQVVQVLKQVYNPQRDEAMGTKIIGLGHVAGLKTKLEDLKPKVMTLAEYGSV